LANPSQKGHTTRHNLASGQVVVGTSIVAPKSEGHPDGCPLLVKYDEIAELRELDAIHTNGECGACCQSKWRGGRALASIAGVAERVLQLGPAELLHAAVSQTDVALLGVHIVHPARALVGGEIRAK
jgi:hypothetical protein